MTVFGRTSTPEPAVDGEDDRLGARPHAELVEEIGDVIADRLFADGEALRNLRVAEAFRDQRQHLPLARGERGERGVLAAGRALKTHELQHLSAEAFPSQLVLKEDVVLRVEFDELSARDPGG